MGYNGRSNERGRSNAYDDMSGRRSRDRYSQNYGYSRDRDMMLSRLESLMSEAGNENERSAIMDCIERIK